VPLLSVRSLAITVSTGGHRRWSPAAWLTGARARVAALLLVTLSLACRPSPPPLSGASASAEALADALVAAYRTRDRAALTRMTMTESEFRQWVWPHLPAARSERNLPFSYVWGDLHQKSDASLQQLFVRYAGRDMATETVRFAAVSPYGQATVHREATITVSSPSGSGEPLRLSGSFLEAGGQWKVFSFVVDD
jgi:hypothetical protein